jgi:hypothetical protein
MMQEMMSMIKELKGEDGAAESTSSAAADTSASNPYTINTGSGDDIVNIGMSEATATA